MSGYDKRRIFRVYACGKSYVLASQLVEDEKLLLTMLDNAEFCLNTISTDEWTQMKDKMGTNSVRSPSYGTVLEAFGCLGLLSISTQQMQHYNHQQQQQQHHHHHHHHHQSSQRSARVTDAPGASMHHFLVFVKEALSVGTIRQCEVMKITDVLILPLTADQNGPISPNSSNSGGGGSAAGTQGYLNDIRLEIKILPLLMCCRVLFSSC